MTLLEKLDRFLELAGKRQSEVSQAEAFEICGMHRRDAPEFARLLKEAIDLIRVMGGLSEHDEIRQQARKFIKKLEDGNG